MIEKYGNKHTIASFKGRTAYVDATSSNDGGSKDTTPKSRTVSKSDTLQDFSSAIAGKKKLQKKMT